MNQEEAIQYALTVRWKTSACEKKEFEVMEPEEKIVPDDTKEPIRLARELHKEIARHIVEIHNKKIEWAQDFK